MNWIERYSSTWRMEPSAQLDLLNSLRGKMVAAAQAVYDAWEQDEDGFDFEFGAGGICDAISKEIGGVLIVDILSRLKP